MNTVLYATNYIRNKAVHSMRGGQGVSHYTPTHLTPPTPHGINPTSLHLPYPLIPPHPLNSARTYHPIQTPTPESSNLPCLSNPVINKVSTIIGLNHISIHCNIVPSSNKILINEHRFSD